MFNHLDLKLASRIAIKSAIEAGECLSHYLYKTKQITYKGTTDSSSTTSCDMVTQADLEAELCIISNIKKHFPDHNIEAEESNNCLHNTNSHFTWVIDPLDGTTNFVHSFPHFSVSIALSFKGEPILGVVYDPVKNELFHAIKDQGATLNGRPIFVSDVDCIEKSLLVTGFPYDRHKNIKDYTCIYEDLLCKSQGVRRLGSAALDLAYVACGRFDAYWEFKLKPWDVAAGKIIVEEALGIVVNRSFLNANLYDTLFIAAKSNLAKEIHSIITQYEDPTLI